MEMFMKKRKVDDVETVCYRFETVLKPFAWAQARWSYQAIDLPGAQVGW